MPRPGEAQVGLQMLLAPSLSMWESIANRQGMASWATLRAIGEAVAQNRGLLWQKTHF